MLAKNQSSNTVAQREPEEKIYFRVSAAFKEAVDVCVARRRTTLRAVCTAALKKYLGIDLPNEHQETAE